MIWNLNGSLCNYESILTQKCSWKSLLVECKATTGKPRAWGSYEFKSSPQPQGDMYDSEHDISQGNII